MELYKGNEQQRQIIINILSEIEDDDLVDIINDYCNNYDNNNQIYYMSELDSKMKGKSATTILNELSEDFSINDDYFIITENGLKSDNDARQLMCCEYYDLADYILSNNDFYYILDTYTERLFDAFIDYVCEVISNSVYSDELQDIISYIQSYYWYEVYETLWEDLIIELINDFHKKQNERNELDY